VRRERLLRDQLDDNLLVRWFVGLNMDDPSWDASTFSKNRERWLEGDVARAVFDQVLAQARERKPLSDEHCTVDGTLIAAGAGQKRFTRKSTEVPSSPPDDPGHPSIDFRGERRTNATHPSMTDPEARLDKKAKGPEAKLAYLGHVRMEHRHGLVVDTRVTQATGTAEREAALAMAEEIPGQPRVTMGADKNYDTRDCVRELRELRVTPPVAQNPTGRSSAIDGRTTRHPGYAVSQPAAQLHRRGLRLAQDRRAAAQGAAAWGRPSGLDVHVCRRGVQLGPDAHAGGGGRRAREGTQVKPPRHVAALALAEGAQSSDAPQSLPSYIKNFAGPAGPASDESFSAAC
jgi:IS5 family transposase